MLMVLVTSLLLLSTNAFADTGENIAIWSATCDQDQYLKDGYCYIECNVDKIETDPLEWTNFAWKYYAQYNSDDNPGHDYYQLFDNVTDVSTNDNYTMGLTLLSVSAGYYVCEFTLSEDTENVVYRNHLKIAQSAGSGIKEPCIDSIDCYSLNAACKDLGFTKICTCGRSNNITEVEGSVTIACLKPLSEGSNCNFDSECAQYQQDYTCSTTDHNCTCSGVDMKIDGGYEDPMCVKPAYLMDSCDFDEQCQFTESNSVCVNNKCDCIPGFIKSMSGKPEQYCCYKQIVTWSHTCTQDQFQANGNCYIECSVSKSDADPFPWSGFAWKYYAQYNLDSDPQHNSYQLFDNVNNVSTDTAYTMGLTLTSVSAGYYVCEYTFLNDTQKVLNRNHLKISNSEGVGINWNCSQPIDCYSLNAKCNKKDYRSACECSYNLTEVEGSVTIACLQPLQEGDSCNFASECAQYQQAYTCSSTSHNCTCSGVKEHVDGGYMDPMCIKQVYLMSTCDFTEQCLLAADNSVCMEQMCDCVSGYTMAMEGHPNEFYCYIPPSGVTTWGTGAIVGVSVGCGVGLALVIGIITYFVKTSA